MGPEPFCKAGLLDRCCCVFNQDDKIAGIGRGLTRTEEVYDASGLRITPGVSIGLMYLPECYETAEEPGEILKPVGEFSRVVAAHIRGEGDSLVKSVEEIIKIACK